jgi:5-hydroxyisourate hydrolase
VYAKVYTLLAGWQVAIATAGRKTGTRFRKEHTPMGHLSTHVLDTMNGCPAAGMRVSLQRVDGARTETIKSFTLNADGRNDGGALLDANSMAVGRYRLSFSVAPYFQSRGVQLPDPPFIDEVQLDFGIADAAGHYHVPLLVSPWAYSTYRGS